MEKFDLDATLMQFGQKDSLSQSWRIRHSILGVQVFGSNGSGKSSSLKTLAFKYLRAGYGFLVLSVKSERETWEDYARATGREKDVVVIGPNSPRRFDFMKYLSRAQSGSALTTNLLNVLMAVINSTESFDGGNGQDPFWERSLRLLLHNTIALQQIAHGHVSVQGLYDIVQSSPKGDDDETAEDNKLDSNGAFLKTYQAAKEKIAQQYEDWKAGWSWGETARFKNREVLENVMLELLPEARQFKLAEQFFFETFKTLSGKTKSIILLSVSNFLFSLLQDPVYSLFCSGKIDVVPEETLDGRIIILDIPTKYHHGAGRAAQLLFKYIWQLQVEKRDVNANDRPVCLWSDESAELLLEHDAIFQATARSSRVAVVYITQNVHQYYAALSGPKAADRIASFLGTLNTHIYFSNSDATTNKMASDRIGDEVFYEPSTSVTTSEKFSQTDSVHIKIEKAVKPEKFGSLMTGSPINRCMVEAYIHMQGDKLFNGKNYKKIKFNQNYK